VVWRCGLPDPPGASGAAASGQDQRITLTASAVKGAAWMGLMIAGEDKKEALGEALLGGSVAEMPVRAILPRPGLRIHWAA
jgi:6-phosphogluconolactonase